MSRVQALNVALRGLVGATGTTGVGGEQAAKQAVERHDPGSGGVVAVILGTAPGAGCLIVSIGLIAESCIQFLDANHRQ